ncbi:MULTISPECIES: hypothetical protein [Delftia]|jgi:hypothetical protein|uniref:Uncharacterized protein n=1 Tax=Delftia tsuruhatensis TaxID=180282 RepID=A0AAX3SFU6_9BURK|nr:MULTISPECIES: hypothetical protein [Delftia]MBS3723206.1 hypothetical protein [Delftia sp. PE138]WFF78917.1 hypothetical protein PYR84_18450 [Delftia tsuruhatensis]
MKQTRTAAIVLVLALAAGSAVARSTDIYEPPAVMWTASPETTTQQLHDRIVVASKSLGWVVVGDEPGRLELHYDKQGKHQVNIAVHYNTDTYRISYLHSVNLNYSEGDGKREIHPNYNRWVRNLMKKISTP